MFPNLGSDPVECRSQVDEAEKGDGELLVLRGDAAVMFDAAEEVLDGMAKAIGQR